MQARTSKNMECLSMELKAFEKSRRRVHYSLGGMLASLWTEFTACTMASDPTLTPTPNWSGVRVSMASDRARWETFRCKAAENFPHSDGSQATSLLLGCQKGSTSEMWDDIRRAVAGAQELDDSSERTGCMS